jgi:formylglycine-generating enzyme required for sulfatase activity
MSEVTSVPPPERPKRRLARRWWLGGALVALAWARWWFGVELPERRAAAELKRQQAEKSFRIADLGLDMVWIPPGTFLMGTPGRGLLAKWFYRFRENVTHQSVPPDFGEDNERQATWVTLTQPFWIGRTEVTQAQWQAVMGSNPSTFKGNDLPVANVSGNAAMEFCRKLTEREWTTGRLTKDYIYTLPTEAQWEYACRAGTTGDYAGDLNAIAWYDANSGNKPHPVGTHQPNAWGLWDMHGNVIEQCLDWYGSYPGGAVTNPSGPVPGILQASRGGGWQFNMAHARSAYRVAGSPAGSDLNTGFRLALTLTTVVVSPPGARTEKN